MDVSSGAAAFEALVPHLPGHMRTVGGRAAYRVETANFRFTDLSVWRDSLAEFLFDMDGFVSLDLDERNNLIRVGLADSASMADARSLVRQLGIPDGAVALGTEKRPHLTSKSLFERFRPMLGGSQIGPRGCSLNIIAQWGTTPVLLTNSHCTATYNGLDYGWTSQQYAITDSSGTPVHWGTEIFDTGGYVCGVLNLDRCREADAAAYDLTGIDVRSGETGWVYGRIARTTYSSVGTTGIPGSLDVDTNNPYFSVQGDNLTPWAGQAVQKVGVGSGWTTGTVQETCKDIKLNGINWVCQASADYGVVGGDSGSPVFSVFDIVYYVGMNWSGTDNHIAFFAPSGQIHKELGARTLFVYP